MNFETRKTPLSSYPTVPLPIFILYIGNRMTCKSDPEKICITCAIIKSRHSMITLYISFFTDVLLIKSEMSEDQVPAPSIYNYFFAG